MLPRGFFYPLSFFFFNDTATTEIYTLSLHDALPIWSALGPGGGLARRRRVLGLEPRGDRFRLGPPLAPGRLLLPLARHLRLDPGLGRVGHALAFLTVLAQRLLAPGLRDDVRQRRRDQRYGADRVVVARHRYGDQVGIRVGVHDGDHGDAQLVGFGHRDALLLRVHDEQGPGQACHVLDTRQVLLELDALAVEEQLLLLGVVLEVALDRPLLQLLQPLDLPLHGLEVGQRPPQPALGHVEGAAPLRLRLQDQLQLLLGAYEEHTLALQHDRPQQLLGLLELPQRLLKVDDVDAGAFREDETAHLRVPPTRLMPEVDTRFEQVLQLRLRHALPFRGCSAAALVSRSAPPRGDPDGIKRRV